jgi:hypothetical protein
MAEQKKTGELERRTHRRISVSLPLLIRGHDIHGTAFEETASSYDVSREGASFLTRHELEIGQQLELTFLRRQSARESAGRGDFETIGEVRRLVLKSPGEWEVGVHFIGPRLRTYISETA